MNIGQAARRAAVRRGKPARSSGKERWADLLNMQDATQQITLVSTLSADQWAAFSRELVIQEGQR